MALDSTLGTGWKNKSMALPTRSSWYDLARVGDVTIITFTCQRLMGEKTVQAVGERLVRLVEEGWHKKLVLNLGSLESVSSTMIARFITVHRKTKETGGHLAICNLQPELDDVFKTLQLHRLLNLYADQEQALKSFQ